MRRKETTEELANIPTFDEIQYSRKVKLFVCKKVQLLRLCIVTFHFITLKQLVIWQYT